MPLPAMIMHGPLDVVERARIGRLGTRVRNVQVRPQFAGRHHRPVPPRQIVHCSGRKSWSPRSPSGCRGKSGNLGSVLRLERSGQEIKQQLRATDGEDRHQNLGAWFSMARAIIFRPSIAVSCKRAMIAIAISRLHDHGVGLLKRSGIVHAAARRADPDRRKRPPLSLSRFPPPSVRYWPSRSRVRHQQNGPGFRGNLDGLVIFDWPQQWFQVAHIRFFEQRFQRCLAIADAILVLAFEIRFLQR